LSNSLQLDDVVIELKASTLKSRDRSITGGIALRVADLVFPQIGWRDFPVVILSWWLESTSKLAYGRSHVCECRFMDGPFFFRLARQDENTWTLAGFEGKCVKFTAKISRQAFLQNLLAAADKALEECKRRGWKGRDIDVLEAAARAASDDLV
jgi:hypothetical protein